MNKSLVYILMAFLYMKTNCAETDIFALTTPFITPTIKRESLGDIFQFIKPLPELKVIALPLPPIPEYELEYIKKELDAIHRQAETIELLLRAILDRYNTHNTIIEKTDELTQKSHHRKRKKKRKRNTLDRSTTCKKKSKLKLNTTK
jgi:hypothetical protein